MRVELRIRARTLTTSTALARLQGRANARNMLIALPSPCSRFACRCRTSPCARRDASTAHAMTRSPTDARTGFVVGKTSGNAFGRLQCETPARPCRGAGADHTLKDPSTARPCGTRLLRSITRARDGMFSRCLRFDLLLKLAAPFTDRTAPECSGWLRMNRHRRRNITSRLRSRAPDFRAIHHDSLPCDSAYRGSVPNHSSTGDADLLPVRSTPRRSPGEPLPTRPATGDPRTATEARDPHGSAPFLRPRQSQLSAPPVWYSMTRVSKKFFSFFRSIISDIHGNGFVAPG
jgi:hypothetical protein